MTWQNARNRTRRCNLVGSPAIRLIYQVRQEATQFEGLRTMEAVGVGPFLRISSLCSRIRYHTGSVHHLIQGWIHGWRGRVKNWLKHLPSPVNLAEKSTGARRGYVPDLRCIQSPGCILRRNHRIRPMNRSSSNERLSPGPEYTAYGPGLCHFAVNVKTLVLCAVAPVTVS